MQLVITVFSCVMIIFCTFDGGNDGLERDAIEEDGMVMCMQM